MIVPKATIKEWFETGDVPTQEQFYNFIDSMLHIDAITRVSDKFVNQASSNFTLVGDMPSDEFIDVYLNGSKIWLDPDSQYGEFGYTVSGQVVTLNAAITSDDYVEITRLLINKNL